MAAPPPIDPSLLSNLERAVFNPLTTHQKVLIAQATYARGNRDWRGVSDLLKGHVLLKGVSEGWYEPNRLEAAFDALVKALALDASGDLAPQAPLLQRIAHAYYMERVRELYAEMQLCQDQFRIAFSEIEEIKQGKHDWKYSEPNRTKPPGQSPENKLGQLPPLPGM
ncbi:hypothetical protein JCM10212_004115 [Sporobolomyces blumeae]